MRDQHGDGDARSGRTPLPGEIDGEFRDATTRPGVQTVIRRRISGGFNPDSPSSQSDIPSPVRPGRNPASGGFGPEVVDDASRTFGSRTESGQSRPGVSGAGLSGPGRAGGPPTAEVKAAEQMLMLKLDHRFITLEPLSVALTHPSWRNERPHVTIDNQRLEFLGDLVLGLAIGDILLVRLPDSQEGELSVLKAQLVRESALAALAERLGVGPALRLGRGEEQSGGRHRPAVLADAMEAILGAVFVDAGYERSREVIERLLAQPLAQLLAETREAAATTTTALHATIKNYKTALQEWLAQAHGDAPEYQVVCELGPPNARQFRVQVQAQLAGTVHRANGEAPTIKAAENAAAAQLFRTLTPG